MKGLSYSFDDQNKTFRVSIPYCFLICCLDGNLMDLTSVELTTTPKGPILPLQW